VKETILWINTIVASKTKLANLLLLKIVRKGSFVAIVGRVGSGKSSLLSALTSDMEKIGGFVNVDGTCAYLPQQAW
jgi:ABC-type bacteriocin/lantibiotic exporter with double-glycine peptidase domain